MFNVRAMGRVGRRMAQVQQRRGMAGHGAPQYTGFELAVRSKLSDENVSALHTYIAGFDAAQLHRSKSDHVSRSTRLRFIRPPSACRQKNARWGPEHFALVSLCNVCKCMRCSSNTKPSTTNRNTERSLLVHSAACNSIRSSCRIICITIAMQDNWPG
jgi:hypothetical protein